MRILSIISIVEHLFAAFDVTALPAFRAFIKQHYGVSKWSIASDYSKDYGCFTFSIIPYIEPPQETFNYIQSKLPMDIKKTKNISDELIAFFRENNKFHISIKIQNNTNLFYSGTEVNSLDLARECIRKDYGLSCIAGGDPAELNKIKRLYEDSKKTSFNLSLFTNMIMLASFYVFTSLLIARERITEIIGWFSDRDRMISYCDGVVWTFATQAFNSLAYSMNYSHVPKIIIAGHTEASGSMWFDSLIRPADYISQAIANLAVKDGGLIKKQATKQYKLLAGIFPENEYIVILHAKFRHVSAEVERLILSYI